MGTQDFKQYLDYKICLHLPSSLMLGERSVLSHTTQLFKLHQVSERAPNTRVENTWAVAFTLHSVAHECDSMIPGCW